MFFFKSLFFKFGPGNQFPNDVTTIIKINKLNVWIVCLHVLACMPTTGSQTSIKKSGLKSNFDYSFKIFLFFFLFYDRGYNELKMYIKLNNFVCFASHSIDFIGSICVDLKFLKIQPERNQLHTQKWLRLVKKREGEDLPLHILSIFFPSTCDSFIYVFISIFLQVILVCVAMFLCYVAVNANPIGHFEAAAGIECDHGSPNDPCY